MTLLEKGVKGWRMVNVRVLGGWEEVLSEMVDPGWNMGGTSNCCGEGAILDIATSEREVAFWVQNDNSSEKVVDL